jgi:hypothetical protein
MAREQMPEGPGRPPFSASKQTEKAVAGGSSLVMLAGLASIVLVILSFIGVLRIPLAAVATIVIGAGLFFQGLAITRRHDQIREELAAAGNTKAAQGIGSGMTVELIAGIIGIVLGIVALLGGVPHALLAISVIAFGVALILGGPLTTRLDDLNVASSRAEGAPLGGSRKVVRTASGLEVLIGIAAVVLGVLALIAFTHNFMLILVGLIITGAALAFSGGVIARRAGAVS